MRIIDPVLMEIDLEAGTTQRVLERVPADRLTWKPHVKSMSVGQLALHVASSPGWVAGMLVTDEFGMTLDELKHIPAPETSEDIMTAHAESLAKAKQILGGLDDAAVMTTWSFKVEGVTVFSAPKLGIIRALVLNHWYHHRGQLSVYLRLLDVPVPPIYGASADENPYIVAGVGQ